MFLALPLIKLNNILIWRTVVFYRFKYFIFIFLSVIFTLMISVSCRKNEKLDPTPGLTLSFSTDTVFFDTVFPTVGSVTRRLVVYNNHDRKVSISRISVAGGSSSSFRINVNGISSGEVADVEIPGNDSIYIFVRVTVDPHNVNTPFVVDDSIGFVMNGNQQFVKLVAWGRDAIFYRKGTLNGQNIWDSTRAHVIYESLRVDTNSLLIIMPGARVYFHKEAYMAVSYNATLKIPGSLDHPVRFQGDRLDPYYKDLPGQWGGIFLEAGSKDHFFDHVIIKNGTFGIYADSSVSELTPVLILKNTIIQNVTSSGIVGYGTSIVSENCVIGSCGGPSVDINYGGAYDFRQLTIGNYWTSSVRNIPALYMSNYSYDTSGTKITHPLTKAYFGNIILYGSNQEEIMLDSVAGTGFNFQFDHALLKTQLKTVDPSKYINCMVNKDPGFIDAQKMDYRIDSISPAIGKGKFLEIPFDIRGIDRGNTPALGAYEYLKE